jgi:hypothetical protein
MTFPEQPTQLDRALALFAARQSTDPRAAVGRFGSAF